MQAPLDEKFARAAELIAQADALIVGAGAGMGVDSGLPDFRGRNGFWRAYPALGKRKIRFENIACPESFERRAWTIWGFYGHRLRLYRNTVPHAGYTILQEIGATKKHGVFVCTSNVDGQFQKAGFDPNRIHEIHGSLHKLQCLTPCTSETWSADSFAPEIDPQRGMLTSALPTCPRCGGVARPNALLFDAHDWIDAEYELQAARFERWRAGVERLVVIEIGAGVAIVTVRRFCERQGVPLIRINPRNSKMMQATNLGIPCDALDGLVQIQRRFISSGFTIGN